MPLPRLDRATLVLLSVCMFFAPGCARLLAVPECGRSLLNDGTGGVKIDLKGIRGHHGERPDGVEIALQRLETDQVMYILTEREGPTKIDKLPVGKYEIRCGDARLGTAKKLKRTFKVVAGSTMLVYLDDGWARFEYNFAQVVTGIVTGIGYFFLGVGYVLLGVVIVAAIVGYFWLNAGAPGLGDGKHRTH